MIEGAINAKLERKLAEDALGLSYSVVIALLWSLRKLPIIGASCGSMAATIRINLKNGQLYQDGKIRLTVPKSMVDADLDSKFETEYINK